MGKLIASAQATVDGVIDPVGEWVYWGSRTGKWADMLTALPKSVGSTALSGELECNATLLDRDHESSLPELKDEVDSSGAGGTSTCSATAGPSGWSSRT